MAKNLRWVFEWQRGMDGEATSFDSKQQALEAAELDWNHLLPKERKEYYCFYVGLINCEDDGTPFREQENGFCDADIYELAKDFTTGSAADEQVKGWYTSNYPDDELGESINEHVTFMDIFDALDNYRDVYALLGEGDTVVRERVFSHLADIMNVDYGYIYDQWMRAI